MASAVLSHFVVLAAISVPEHLRWSSAYGAGTLDSAFINLAHASDLGTVEALEKVGIRSMLEPFQGGPFKVFNRSTVRGEGSLLVPGWQQIVDNLVTKMQPQVSKTGIVGVFLGDEVCCHAPSCLNTTLEPVAARLRATFSTDELLLWENECGDSIAGLPNETGAIPPSLDIVSIDIYAGFLPRDGANVSGSDEVVEAKKFFNEHVFPRMSPHQTAFVVPGFFGCSQNATWPQNGTARAGIPTASWQQDRLLEKLDAYKKYLQEEPRLSGLAPWHLRNRSNDQNAKSRCDMRLGAVSFPKLMEEWAQFGGEIVNKTRSETVKM